MYEQIKDFLSDPSFKDDWPDLFHETWRMYLGQSGFYYTHT